MAATPEKATSCCSSPGVDRSAATKVVAHASVADADAAADLAGATVISLVSPAEDVQEASNKPAANGIPVVTRAQASHPLDPLSATEISFGVANVWAAGATRERYYVCNDPSTEFKDPMQLSLQPEAPASFRRSNCPELRSYRRKYKEEEKSLTDRWDVKWRSRAANANSNGEGSSLCLARGIPSRKIIVPVFFFVASVIFPFKAATGESDALFTKVVHILLSMAQMLSSCDLVLSRLERERIDYSFLFEFYSANKLNRNVLLICTLFATPVLAYYNFIKNGHPFMPVEVTSFLVDLICLIVFLYHYLRLIWSLIYCNKVTFVDAFMADQLCSLAPLHVDIVHVTSYYLTGSYQTQDLGLSIAIAVTLLPFFLRDLQCRRSWLDTREKNNLINRGKYISAMFDVVAKMIYEEYGGWFKVLYISIAFITTFYQVFWDTVMDWGLLQANSRNPRLRDNLMLRNKSFYFLAMALNFVLRHAWLLGLLSSSEFISRLKASLEVIRRALWNFFRLEYEHVRNAEEFNAI